MAPLDGDVLQQVKRIASAPCPQRIATSANARSILRFDVGEKPTAPRYLVSRTAMFESLTLVTQDKAGNWASAAYEFGDLRGTFFDRQFYAELPQAAQQSVQPAQTIYAVFDRPTQRVILDYARPLADLPGNSDAQRDRLIVVAIVLGMIAMALVFDVAFFKFLQGRFIAWHGIFVTAMMIYMATSSGLISLVVDLSLMPLRVLMVGSFGMIVIAAMQFAISFVEPGTLKPRHIRSIHIVSLAMAGASILHFSGVTALGSFPANLFYIVGGVTGVAFVWICLAAWNGGSRAVRFPVIAYMPLIVVAGFRVFTYLAPGMPTMDHNSLFIAASLIEVAVTTLGVASRFAALRGERDRAKAEAEMLEKLADQDPMTGLMNRRAIEPSFSQIYGNGFTSFALIDLDRFKSVNDEFGHAKGDEVLCTAARALAPDADTMAIRMGGEEFMLLLRGENARERVEQRRQAITRLVAHEIPGLDRPITASAGFVELPKSGGERFSFDATYAHVDRLLYEAKNTGRNRLVSERMRVFAGGMPHDRRANSRNQAA